MAVIGSLVLPTACIPWTEDGRVDADIFQGTVRSRLANGIRRLYVFGTVGEEYAVTESQFDTIIGLLAEACAGTPDAHPMVGLITGSTGTMIE